MIVCTFRAPASAAGHSPSLLLTEQVVAPATPEHWQCRLDRHWGLGRSVQLSMIQGFGVESACNI